MDEPQCSPRYRSLINPNSRKLKTAAFQRTHEIAADRTEMGTAQRLRSAHPQDAFGFGAAAPQLRFSLINFSQEARSNTRSPSSVRDRLACRAYSILLAPICFPVLHHLATALLRFREAASQFEREGLAERLLGSIVFSFEIISA